MSTWNSRGLRGSTLEDFINFSIEKYTESGIALIQKIPTPIKPIKIDSENRHITLAYFDKKSTVDYIGVVQGIPVCFDAKECACDTFSMQNIHDHQFLFMERFERQKGISFILLYYSHLNEGYYIPFAKLKEFHNRSKTGGRKSFKIEEIDKSFKIRSYQGVPLHFLEMLQRDLLLRDRESTEN
ncbi:MAG: Holliday junction resolvase RecU [Lachnospiraceae bacterium]